MKKNFINSLICTLITYESISSLLDITSISNEYHIYFLSPTVVILISIYIIFLIKQYHIQISLNRKKYIYCMLCSFFYSILIFLICLVLPVLKLIFLILSIIVVLTFIKDKKYGLFMKNSSYGLLIKNKESNDVENSEWKSNVIQQYKLHFRIIQLGLTIIIFDYLLNIIVNAAVLWKSMQ